MNKICTDCEESFYDALGYSICSHCRNCMANENALEDRASEFSEWCFVTGNPNRLDMVEWQEQRHAGYINV